MSIYLEVFQNDDHKELNTITISYNNGMTRVVQDSLLDGLMAMQVILLDQKGWDGRNPFTRHDTVKYERHFIRYCIIHDDGSLTETEIDTTFYKSMDICSQSTMRICQDTICISSWSNKQGGIGGTYMYINGYRIGTPTRGGGIYKSYRTPNDTTNMHLPIGEQCYLYDYDDLNRLSLIESINTRDTIYSIKYDKVGLWKELILNDIHIKRTKR